MSHLELVVRIRPRAVARAGLRPFAIALPAPYNLSPRRLVLIWIWERPEIGNAGGDSNLQGRNYCIDDH